MKTITIALALAVAFTGVARAQEHPEHPTASKAKPEHTYTMDELEKAIVSDIKDAEKKNGGVYKIKDTESGNTLDLTLDHVHRERLARLDAKTYFACTDFKSSDGHTVDVDFFMKDNGKKLLMTDATVHKIDGKPRYNWKEKDGYWERVPVEKSQGTR